MNNKEYKMKTHQLLFICGVILVAGASAAHPISAIIAGSMGLVLMALASVF